MKKVATLLTGLTVALSACGTSTNAPQASLSSSSGLAPQAVTGCATANLAQGRTALASSTENAGYLDAKFAVDGDATTRWASQATDNQWLQVDLGSPQQLCGVTLQWEAAYAKTFQIEVSSDGTSWSPASAVINGTGGTQNVSISGTGRYVRMKGLTRATGYGYSLYELQVFGTTSTGGGTTTCSTTNFAQGKPASASSTENANALDAKFAVDGDSTTRWASQATDAQWLQVDLGSAQNVCGVSLQWEAAYAKTFRIDVSNDGTTWTPATGTISGTGGTQNVNLSASGRYVRMTGLTRATGYGYSIYEFKVFTSGTGTGGTTPLPTSDTPDFGPNVAIFDPSTPVATIQSKLDTAFNAQLKNPDAQFGDQRNVFLFKPGSYGRVYANVGFYTTLAGVGRNPDDVTINGAINVDSGWVYGDEKNATQNFWRSAENLAVVPEGGTNRWAVSQAAPMRRVHIRGNLTMGPSNQDFGQGYSSGGFIADSKVDGAVTSGSQQQWYTRDSTIGSWSGSNWNMVFSGVQGAPAQSFPTPPYTTLATTPVSREKPYLYFENGKYSVFVPSLRTNASGITWPNTPGTSIPMSQFYVARPTDSAATLNQALAQGLNLFFTPGVYHLNQTLNVTRAGTVVTGIGFPTLVPDGGVNAMQVADVDGVNVSSLLFDAGTVNSPALLTVGTAGAHVNHAANPVSVQDVYFRIGGAVAGKSTTSLIVHSDNTVVDHIWAWRADHGKYPTGWTVNTADTGVIVNGNNVLATGLFVEHYQKYQVIWNGQGGKTVFFQNEMPYDAPDQATWRTGANGYAAYKVADSVTTHEAWGLGAYAYFNVNPSLHADRGFEVPNTPGVKFHDVLTVSLGNTGTIDHVINGVGAAVPFADPAKNTAPSNVVSYP
ncbi:discoidin domain-containing protein [Deinococcus hopiensis]|uniref:F5/8 type C domain-containing protein n=1 Tax=Deinococcus hopiensis KR-140 TaxID=695939 RepID=A0A1W1UCL1_9DEIO|nr:discoidin domain-containing protein [Deinococcus hopiensis]SMB78762.1 F5/8 type C domain-containing protein [Deinococcus hopiensis KR-140]